MKKYNSILKYILIVITALFITGCVHDDKYDEPNLEGYGCRSEDYYTQQGYVKWTLDVLKGKAQNTAFADKAYIEGYVSSTDETGNIYKTIYIQDSPENPTQGLTVSVNMVSTYTRFPQGSKVYIDVQGLALTAYGGVVQLGMITPAGTRIPEKEVKNHIAKDCNIKANIVPKIMTIAQFTAAGSNNLIGCLIQLDDVEFENRALCTTYAPTAVTVNKIIGEGGSLQNGVWKYAKTAIVRNSGYASFANRVLPAGKGSFVGIFSKYNSDFQLYINNSEDLKMNNFPRLDGITSNPCEFNQSALTPKTVAEVKNLAVAGANWTEITGDFSLKAQVVANDETGNLYKYLYVEDATGGIRININKVDLFLDSRFRLGKDVNIKLKGMYIRNVSGELQLGGLFVNGGVTQFGQIEEMNMYKYFFDSNTVVRSVIPTERTISQLTNADVGRWIKLKDVQFINSDLGKMLTESNAVTNRTLEDCSGKTIILRTSYQADFGTKDNPLKPATVELEGGKGDAYAVLSVFNGTYQLWITRLANIDFDNTPRCDGSVYTPIPTVFSDNFASGLVNWTTVSVTGAQTWLVSNQGNNGNNYAIMNGFASGNNANEDWLISKEVSLVGKTQAILNFTTDVRYAGNVLQVYATDNYTGTPSTTVWTQLSPTLDTNSGAFGDWVSSGNVSLNAFLGKNVRIAFKYTSTTSAAATWEVDDFKIKAQ